MAFKEVTKAPTQREITTLERKHRKLQEKYDSLKYQFLEAVGAEDFEVLSVQDFLELKELYIEKKLLYWKIHELKHPEDTATREAYRFLNSMGHNDQFDFLMKHHMTTHRLIDKIRENPKFLEEVTA